MKQRVLSILLVLCLVVAMVPMAAFATDSSEVQSDTTISDESPILLSGAANFPEGRLASLHFGQYPQNSSDKNIKQPIEWQVLNRDRLWWISSGKTMGLFNENSIMLIATKVLDCIPYMKVDVSKWKHDNTGFAIQYSDSYVHQFLNGSFHYNAFSDIEDAALNPKFFVLGGNGYLNTSYTSEAPDGKVFAPDLFVDRDFSVNRLSGLQLFQATAYAKYRGVPTSTYNGNEFAYYWLRTPPAQTAYLYVDQGVGGIHMGMSMDGKNKKDSLGILPMIKIKGDSILLASKVGAKSESYILNQGAGSDAVEYKLTLLDKERPFKATLSEDPFFDEVNKKLTFSLNYEGATTGSDEYISYILTDPDNKVIEYRRLQAVTALSGNVVITFDSQRMMGKNYTLKVFNENVNASNYIDLGSAFSQFDANIPKSKAFAFESAIQVKTETPQAQMSFALKDATYDFTKGQFLPVESTLTMGITCEYQPGNLTIKHATDLPLGRYPFVYKEDGKLASDKVYLEIQSNLAPVIVTTKLPTIYVGEPYEAYLEAQGSQDTLSWYMYKDTMGFFIDGLSYSPALGKIYGTYKKINGHSAPITGTIRVQAKNEYGQTEYQTVSFEVAYKDKQVNTYNSSQVYFGGRSWSIIGYDGDGALSNKGEMALLLDDPYAQTTFAKESDPNNASYESSNYKAIIDQELRGVDPREKAIINPVTLIGGAADDVESSGMVGNTVHDALFWPPSRDEAMQIKKWPEGYYFLRSPGKAYAASGDDRLRILAKAGASVNGVQLTHAICHIRPVTKLNLSRVAFITPAENGKSSVIRSTLLPIVNTWDKVNRLSIVDNGQQVTFSNIRQDNLEVTVSYSGATTGANHYISVAIKDNTGNVRFYGTVADLSSSGAGDATFTLPSEFFTEDGMQLFIFNEYRPGGTSSDFISEPYEITNNIQPVSMEATPQAIFEAMGVNNGLLSNVTTDMKYSTDSGESWQDITDTTFAIDQVDPYNGVWVKAIKKSCLLDSKVQKIALTRSNAPTGLTGIDETYRLNDGQINGVNDTMEYRMSTDLDFKPVTGDQIVGLAPTRDPIHYQVRFKARGTELASPITKITISAFWKRNPNASQFYFDQSDRYYTGQAMPVTVLPAEEGIGEIKAVKYRVRIGNATYADPTLEAPVLPGYYLVYVDVEEGPKHTANSLTQVGSFNILKGLYSGESQLETSVMANKAQTGITLELPELVDGGSYDTTTVSIEGDTPALVSNAVVSGTTLTFDVTAQEPTAATIKIPVNGGDKYQNYTITVTVNAVKETVEITGLSAPSDRHYCGAAVANSEFGTPVLTPSLPDVVLEYNYYKGEAAPENKLDAAPTDAGDYLLEVKIPDSNADYEGKVTIPFTIEKAPLTLSYTAQSKHYDATTNVDVDVNFAGLRNSESLTKDVDYTVIANFADKNAAPNLPVTGNVTLLDTEKASNYQLVSGTLSEQVATISKVTLTGATITSGGSKVYDGNNSFSNMTVTYSGAVGGETVTGKLSGTTEDANVGERKGLTITQQTLDGDFATNYNLPTSNTFNVAITKSTYTDAIIKTIELYEQQSHSGAIAISDFVLPQGFVDAAIVSVVEKTDAKNILTLSGDKNQSYAISNACVGGDTAVCDVIIASKNYENVTATLTFSILNKNIATITGLGAPADPVYNGLQVTNDAFGTPVLSPALEGVTLVYNYYKDSVTTQNKLTAAPKDVGSYVLRVEIPKDHPTHTGSVEVAFTIDKAPLTITGYTVSDKLYDGTTNATVTSVSLGGLQNGEGLELGKDLVVKNAHFAQKNAATAPINVTGEVELAATNKANNYQLQNDALTGQKTKINKVALTSGTVNPGNKKPYDGNANFAGVTVTYHGGVAGETVTGLVTGTTPDANAATKALEVTGQTLDEAYESNYVLPANASVTGDVTIEKVAPQILIEAPDSQMEGKDVIITVRITNPSGATAGYPLATQLSLTATNATEKIPLTEVASNIPGVYSGVYTIGELDPEGEGTTASFKVTIPHTTDNYTADAVGKTHTLTIDSRYGTQTTLQVDKDAVVYGESVTLTASVSKATQSDPGELSGTIQFQVDGKNVGEAQSIENGDVQLTVDKTELTSLEGGKTHQITAVFKSTNTEYADSSSMETPVTVAQKPLTIQAQNQHTYQYQAIPTVLDLIYTGFVDGEDKTNLSGAYRAKHSAPNTEGAGQFPIHIEVPATETNTNYQITLLPGTLEVVVAEKEEVHTQLPSEVKKPVIIGEPTDSGHQLQVVTAPLVDQDGEQAATWLLSQPENKPNDVMMPYEVELQISTDGTVWRKATPEEISNGAVQLVFPIPHGTSPSTHSYRVYHFENGVDDEASLIPSTVDATSRSLVATVSSFSPFVVVATANPSGGTSYYDEYEFWMSVKDSIQNASYGDVIKVKPNGYDRMPSSVMEALRTSDHASLMLVWGGNTIIIPAHQAQKLEPGRIYWPLTKLAELYNSQNSVQPTELINPETGGSTYVVEAPESKRNSNEPYTLGEKAITPLDAGFEPEAYAGTPDAKLAQKANDFHLAILAVAAALMAGICGGWLWLSSRRTEKGQ